MSFSHSKFKGILNFFSRIPAGVVLSLILCLSLLPAWARAVPAQHGERILWIQLNDDTINPVTAEYISHAIDQATEEKAMCLVLELDTPGGLLNSTRLIVKKILSSAVPVIVYISPGGARAGSAGVFITYAGHLAAMAPSTNIGAAHPVDIGGNSKPEKEGFWDYVKQMKQKSFTEETSEGKSDPVPSSEKISGQSPSPATPTEAVETDDDPMSSKILQDTVAFIKTLAKKRGRNEDWAVNSVTRSSSITETEAVALGVVELIAADPKELLQKLHGRIIRMDGKTVTLNTENAYVKKFPMSARQTFFNILANPNIAYILLILGFYGLLYEITHPGFGVPGIVGTIFLILAFFSMQALPTNFAALALIILGLSLFIGEAFVPGWGILTLGGAVAIVLGSLLLFDSTIEGMRVSLSLIAAVVLPTAGITVFLVRAALRASQRKAMGGKEGLTGEIGKVYKTVGPQREGKIFVHGELWNAYADEDIPANDKVEVISVEGMLLKVKRWNQKE